MSDLVIDKREHKITLIDDVIIQNIHVVGAYAFAVYSVLAMHANNAGQCFPGIDRISTMTGISRPTVIKHLGVLEEKGLISITRRKSEEKGNLSNVYTLHPSKTPLPPLVKQFNPNLVDILESTNTREENNHQDYSKTPLPPQLNYLTPPHDDYVSDDTSSPVDEDLSRLIVKWQETFDGTAWITPSMKIIQEGNDWWGVDVTEYAIEMAKDKRNPAGWLVRVFQNWRKMGKCRQTLNGLYKSEWKKLTRPHRKK